MTVEKHLLLQSMNLPKAKELQEAKRTIYFRIFQKLEVKKSEWICGFIYLFICLRIVEIVFVFAETQSLIHEKATMAGKPFSEPEETLVRMFKIKLKYFILYFILYSISVICQWNVGDWFNPLWSTCQSALVQATEPQPCCWGCLLHSWNSFLMPPWGHHCPYCVNMSMNTSDVTLSTWDDWKQSFYITVRVVLIKAEAELRSTRKWFNLTVTRICWQPSDNLLLRMSSGNCWISHLKESESTFRFKIKDTKYRSKISLPCLQPDPKSFLGWQKAAGGLPLLSLNIFNIKSRKFLKMWLSLFF